MQYHIVYSKSFRKSLKRLSYSGNFDPATLNAVLLSLKEGRVLASVHKDHQLQGLFSGCRECHLKNDLLFIYRANHALQVITAIDIGSHSELFG
jgi:mRNA interferase YafQ